VAITNTRSSWMSWLLPKTRAKTPCPTLSNRLSSSRLRGKESSENSRISWRRRPSEIAWEVGAEVLAKATAEIRVLRPEPKSTLCTMSRSPPSYAQSLTTRMRTPSTPFPSVTLNSSWTSSKLLKKGIFSLFSRVRTTKKRWSLSPRSTRPRRLSTRWSWAR